MAKTKLHKIYITVRKTKEHEIKGWFIVDKKAPVDYKFDTKRKALDYVRENYTDVTVLVQSDQAKFQYTIVLKAKKVVSFVSRSKVATDDTKSTTKDVEQAFKYTHDATKEVEVENEVVPVVWLSLIVLTLLVSAGLAIAAIIIAS